MTNIDIQIKEKEREIQLLKKQQKEIKNKLIDEKIEELNTKIGKIRGECFDIKALYVSSEIADRLQTLVQKMAGFMGLCPYTIIEQSFTYKGIKTYVNYNLSKYEYQIGI